MSKLRSASAIALAAVGLFGFGASASTGAQSTTASPPLCGSSFMISEGTCTYFPTTKNGDLTISGFGHANVVCAGIGVAQLTSTGDTKTTNFQRALYGDLIPCVLDWAGTGSFTAGAN